MYEANGDGPKLIGKELCSDSFLVGIFFSYVFLTKKYISKYTLNRYKDDHLRGKISPQFTLLLRTMIKFVLNKN